MNKHICKLGLIASLVMGVTSVAHAVEGTTLTFHGQIADATCNVSPTATGQNRVELGQYLPTDFPDVAGVLASSKKSTQLDITGCSGTVKSGKAIQLHGAPVLQSSTLATAGVWGDTDSAKTNVGIELKVAANGTAPADFTPNDPNILVTAAETSDTSAAGISVKPVMVEASLKSIAAKTSIQSGDVTSSIVFSAVNN